LCWELHLEEIISRQSGTPKKVWKFSKVTNTKFWNSSKLTDTIFNNTSRFKNDHQNKSNTQPLLERLTNHIQYDKFLPKSMGQEPTNNNQFVSIGRKIQRYQML
jgi:hypothetical protein